ncbi:uncharacterized protein TNCV_4409341 [Trichonephila clavipes]|nr:uncharacterized protein TNCV_4409341 [Trichonephila clavipes]
MVFRESIRMIYLQVRYVSITSRRRMEDSELWWAVGGIEVGQCITDVVRFFGVRHFMVVEIISCEPNSCPKTCSRSSHGYDPRRR